MATSNNKFPKVAHFAQIDPSKFFRQNWQYSIHLHVPKGVNVALLKGLNNEEFYGLAKDVLTVNIPYVQEIDCIRPAAAHITPTLSGGKHVEDRGRNKETKTISGTSGYMAAVKPEKKKSLLSDYKQSVVKTFEGLTGKQKEIEEKALRSGYYWFHSFANLLELYWAIKREEQAEESEKVKLVWYNERDDESWVIVPMNFRWRRSTPKDRFTYSWSLTMEIIEKFDFGEGSTKDLTGSDKLDFAGELKAVKDAINKAIQVFTKIVNLTTGLVKDYANTIIGLITSAADVINAVTGIVTGVLDTVFSIASATLEAFGQLFDAMADIGLGMEDSAVYRAANEGEVGVTQAFDRMLQAYYRIGGQSLEQKEIAYNSLFSGNLFGDKRNIPGGIPLGSVGQSLSSEEDTNTDLGSTPYSTQIPLIPTSHATLPDREVNSKKWRGSKKVTVKTSDTIFDIARREMGDIRYWRDIVLLNGLKAPYIVSNASSKKDGALTYGDSILIPVAEETGSLGVVQTSLKRARQETGFASGGTLRTLSDSTHDVIGSEWVEDQWAGYTCAIRSGTASGESLVVYGNDKSTLFFSHTGSLERGAGIGDTKVYLTEEEAAVFPTSGVMFVGSEQVNITGKYKNEVSFSPALTGSHPKGTTVEQANKSWSVAPDSTSDYLVFLEQRTFADPFLSTIDAAFGMDIKMETNSSGKLDSVFSQDGDVELVVGMDAFIQSLVIGANTEIGGNPFLPNDGLPNLVGSKFTSRIASMYMVYMRRMILADDRVASITSENILLDSGNTILSVDIVVSLKNGALANVQVA